MEKTEKNKTGERELENNPLVSIIIPARNSAHWIERTIDSILCQSYKNWEVIVIDDASTDDTVTVINSMIAKNPGTGAGARIRLIQNETNLGISKNRNIGIRLAQGTFIAMIDSDDIWLDEKKLERQVEFFITSYASHDAQYQTRGVPTDNDRPLGIVGTWMTTIDENDTPIKQLKFAETDEEIRQSILYKNHIMQSSVLILKQAILDADGYDENLITMEDHDLWLKIGNKYSFSTLPIYALGYRVHSEGITKRKKRRVALDELNVIWKHRKSYPGAIKGLIKGAVRFALSLV